jgi:hypothetical protein
MTPSMRIMSELRRKRVTLDILRLNPQPVGVDQALPEVLQLRHTLASKKQQRPP